MIKTPRYLQMSDRVWKDGITYKMEASRSECAFYSIPLKTNQTSVTDGSLFSNNLGYTNNMRMKLKDTFKMKISNGKSKTGQERRKPTT